MGAVWTDGISESESRPTKTSIFLNFSHCGRILRFHPNCNTCGSNGSEKLRNILSASLRVFPPTVRARKCRPLRVRIPKKHRRVPIFENIFWGHFRKQPQVRGKPFPSNIRTCRAPVGCGGYSSSTVGFHGLASRLPAYPSAQGARGKKR